jgi:hypothetical protein
MTVSWLILIVVVAMVQMTASQLCNCITLPSGCNCSALGSCCVGDVNICNVQFNQCVGMSFTLLLILAHCLAADPLIALNKTKACPCLQAYNQCFHNLACQASTQSKAGANCLLLQGQYVTPGYCPLSDLDCIFTPYVRE